MKFYYVYVYKTIQHTWLKMGTGKKPMSLGNRNAWHVGQTGSSKHGP